MGILFTPALGTRQMYLCEFQAGLIQIEKILKQTNNNKNQ